MGLAFWKIKAALAFLFCFVISSKGGSGLNEQNLCLTPRVVHLQRNTTSQTAERLGFFLISHLLIT